MSNICVRITNPMRANKNGHLVGEWVCLPITQDELQAVLTEIGITDEHDQYIISESETENLDIPIAQYTNFSELNKLVARIDELATDDYAKLAAVLEWEAPTDLDAIYDIIDRLDSYIFLPEVQDDTALGKYFANDCNMLHCTIERMKYYFDFYRYGRDLRYRLKMCYTSLGAIIRN